MVEDFYASAGDADNPASARAKPVTPQTFCYASEGEMDSIPHVLPDTDNIADVENQSLQKSI